jgi:hypothetical protein
MFLLLLFADISVVAPTGCGVPDLREAVDAYCRVEADPSERLGCRVAAYALSHCAVDLQEDGGSLRGNIRDPRDSSYAWLMTFERRRAGWKLTRFKYEYDDCDAMGIPPPPRGPLRFADLRRD